MSLRPRSNDKKQSSLSSFFTAKPGPRSSSELAPNYRRVKPEITRTTSSLSKTFNASSGFSETFSSPDTSIDMETHNFRNPINFGKRKVKTENILDSDDVIEIKEMPVKFEMKRSSSDILTMKGGLARKIQRLDKPKPVVQKTSKDDNLSEEQMKVVRAIVQDGENVFFTGSAGTGKSVVLRYVVKQLRSLYGPNVGITASTGMAAINISGSTIHKFLGIGIGLKSPNEMLQMIKKNAFLLDKWLNLRVLVVDEISMIDGLLFHKINELAKLLRKSKQPFGGIQMVCCGDFFQLPPVGNGVIRTKFCFETEAWKSIMKRTIVLTTVFRQRGDTRLIDMLNSLREGDLDEGIVKEFTKLNRKVHYTDGIEPTELYPTRIEVKNANNYKLQQLPSKSVMFNASDSSKDEFSVKQLDNLRCEETVELKEGAQVMHLINSTTNQNLVNGSVGTVLFFSTLGLWKYVTEYYGQIDPHDAQALDELRLVSTRLGNNQPWTDEQNERFSRIPVERYSKVERLCGLAARESPSSILPVVNFVFKGESDVVMVEKHEFVIDIPKPRGQTKEVAANLTRVQLPLVLSWAMSIHKAQGQTIERLKVDLRKIFEIGQTYVALSRVTNKENLEIYNFSADRVRASPVVKEFYRQILGKSKEEVKPLK